MKFDLTKVNAEVTKASITWNKEVVEKYVEELESKYTGLVLTEDNFKDVKSARKEIKDELDGAKRMRIDIVKELTSNLSEFESDMKGFETRIKAVHSEIDTTVKTYENYLKDVKRQEVNEVVNELTSVLNDKYQSQFVSDTKWFNATTSMKKVREAIQEQVDTLKQLQEREESDIELIKKQCGDLPSESFVELYLTGKTLNELFELIETSKKTIEPIVEKVAEIIEPEFEEEQELFNPFENYDRVEVVVNVAKEELDELTHLLNQHNFTFEVK